MVAPLIHARRRRTIALLPDQAEHIQALYDIYDDVVRGASARRPSVTDPTYFGKCQRALHEAQDAVRLLIGDLRELIDDEDSQSFTESS